MSFVPLRCTPALALLGALAAPSLRVRVPASTPAQAVSAPGASSHTTKLNGPLVRTAGDVLDYVLAPDGARVVFRAPRGTSQNYALFSAPADGSAPGVVLYDSALSGGHLGGSTTNIFGAGELDYAVVQALGRVVYVANPNGVDELFSVRLDGSGSTTTLNLPGDALTRFSIAPNGRDVLLVAGHGTLTLFKVPADGSALAVPILSPYRTSWVSPDMKTVVYREFDGFQTNLYQVPADGSAPPTFLAKSQPPSGSAYYLGFTYFDGVAFSDDGKRIVLLEFETDGEDPVGADLLTVALDGSSAARYLNQARLGAFFAEAPFVYDGAERVVFVEGTSLITSTLGGTQRAALNPAGWQDETLVRLSSDRTKVAFAARRTQQRGLFQAPIDASQPALQLAGTTLAIRAVEIVGTDVLYCEQTATGFNGYRVVPLAGGQVRSLNPAPFDQAGVFVLHPGGHDLLFAARQGTASGSDLFTVPLDASALPRQLSAALTANGSVGRFSVAGAGQQVVYFGDATQDETVELFGVPFAGGSAVTLNGSLQIGPVVGDALSFVVSRDEQRVLYRADQDVDDVFGLYVTRTDGSGTPFSVTGGAPPARSVFPGMTLTPGGTRVVYLQATAAGSTSGSLYVASALQPSTPILLDARAGLEQQTPVVASTGRRVAYRRRRTAAGPFELCSARLDGSAPALTLTPASGSVVEFQLSADGMEAFYLADQDVAGVVELYRVRLDGRSAATKVHPPLARTSDVKEFALAPGGRHVVYVADADENERFELYAEALDGGAPPLDSRHLGLGTRARRALNPPLVLGGDVSDFVVTPDGAAVIYRVDQRFDQSFELFRVPITGGPSILLTPVAPAAGTGGVDSDYVLTADGQTIYYRATHVPAVHELYRVAADGSSPPVRLSGAMTSGGDVDSFALAHDQEHLAYIADQRTNDVLELFGVTRTPGTDVLLHGMPANGDVKSLRIAPDSGLVYHKASANAGVLELFAAPLGGSAAPVRVNRPLPIGRQVESDYVPLSAGHALYRADQEVNGVLELFSAIVDSARSETPKGIVSVPH